MHVQSAVGAAHKSWGSALSRLKGRYFGWLAGILILALIRLAALVPLLALILWGKGDPRQLLALITPIAYIFLVFPLRYTTGEAMRRALAGEPLVTAHFLSLAEYGKKLKAVFLQAWHLIPWALPLVLGLATGTYLMYGVEDGTMVFRMLRSLGKVLGEKYGVMEGMYIVAAFGGLLLLVLLYGMLRNGMLRFLFSAMGGDYFAARREMLKRLQGRRAGQWWIGLFQFVPVLLVLLLEAVLGYRMWRLGAFNLAWFCAMAGGILLLFLLTPVWRALQATFICLPEELK